MSYNEIMQALENGFKVYWMHNGYKVFLDNGRLYTIYTYNEWMCGLQESEYKECFIEGA